MKAKKKTHSRHHSAYLHPELQKPRAISKGSISRKKPHHTFTPMKTGQPDPDQVPGIHNPQAVRGGLGPLNEEGEGDRQNDQLAELEQIEPGK